MPPKKRHRPGVLPRLNFSFDELREGHQSLAPPLAIPVNASYLSNLASSSTQQDTAADKTDDNRGSSTSSVPPKPSLGSRKDAPSFQPSRRPNKQLALSAVSSDTEKRAALKALDDDVFAVASKPTHSSYERLWEELHTAWFGPEGPTLPLTTSKIRAVAAMIKREEGAAGRTIFPS